MVNLATKLTLGRMVLIFPTVIFLFIEGFRLVSLLTLASLAIMDSLDGYYARKRGEVTKLGTILDPVADKVTVLALLIALPIVYHPYFPWWFSFLLIGRDLLIIIGWLFHYYLSGNVINIPSKLGKVTMVIQYILIGLSILMTALYLDHNINPLAGRSIIAELIFLAVGFLTIFTTVDYFFNLVHHGFKGHPDITSPMERVKERRDVKRAAKNKPPAKRRVMTRIYERTEIEKKEPKYVPEIIEEFGKFRVCQICQGSMKKGHVAQCKCGRFFHWSCLETMNGECPRCGTVIHMDVEEGAEEEPADESAGVEK